MTRFVLVLIRMLALSLSFILSTLAAAAFVTFALFLGGETQWLHNDPEVVFGSIGFTLAVWVEIARILFLPFLLYVIIAEPTRLSGLVINLAMGGLFALIYMFMTPYAFDLPYTEQQIWTAALAAGFVGGFAHWILAGSRAGRWLGPASVSAPQTD